MILLLQKLKHQIESCFNMLYGGMSMLMTSSMYKGGIIIKARGFQTSMLLSKKHPAIQKIVRKLNNQDKLKIHLTKGYIGYSDVYKLPAIILDNRESFIQALQPFLQSLDPNKVYHVLPVLKAQMIEDTKNFVITEHAIKVHSDIHIVILANNLMLNTNFTMMQYHVSSFMEISLLYREWYDFAELREFKSKSEVINILNKNAAFKDKKLNSTKSDTSILRFQKTKLGTIFMDPNSLSTLFLSDGLTNLKIQDLICLLIYNSWISDYYNLSLLF